MNENVPERFTTPSGNLKGHGDLVVGGSQTEILSFLSAGTVVECKCFVLFLEI